MTFDKGYFISGLAEYWNTLHAVGVESEITKLGYAKCVSTFMHKESLVIISEDFPKENKMHANKQLTLVKLAIFYILC